MKTIGLVGGIGPESTIDYYRKLIARGHWALVIQNVEIAHLLGLMERRALPEVADYLAAAVDRLARGGADVALLAANTPHIVFDEVRRRSALPLVSIVEAACRRVAALGMDRVGLFGTRFTMEADFYPRVFAAQGLLVVMPDEAEQAYIHDRYINELLRGTFLPETRAGLLAIVEAMAARTGVRGILLAGTELPLILSSGAHEGVALLDTAAIHVEAALAAAGD